MRKAGPFIVGHGLVPGCDGETFRRVHDWRIGHFQPVEINFLVKFHAEIFALHPGNPAAYRSDTIEYDNQMLPALDRDIGYAAQALIGKIADTRIPMATALIVQWRFGEQ